ncbi:hypothetical protein [Zoogloea sp.]
MSDRPTFKDVSLKVLICDADNQTAQLLRENLEKLAKVSVQGLESVDNQL